MEVQSTQSLTNNLNLKAPTPSYVSSSSNLGPQASAVPQPNQPTGSTAPTMIQNKSDTSSSAVPTPSPLNEPYNYSYQYPMYQYGPYNQPPHQGGYNYNCFYTQNQNGQVYMPANKPAFYQQQFPPQTTNQNEPYINGQFNQTNKPVSEVKHSPKVSETKTETTPSKKKSLKKSDVKFFQLTFCYFSFDLIFF